MTKKIRAMISSELIVSWVYYSFLKNKGYTGKWQSRFGGWTTNTVVGVLFLLARQRLYRNDEDLVDKVILLSVYYFFLKYKGCTEMKKKMWLINWYCIQCIISYWKTKAVPKMTKKIRMIKWYCCECLPFKSCTENNIEGSGGELILLLFYSLLKDTDLCRDKKQCGWLVAGLIKTYCSTV